ncbi:MAG TPA: hypothetical protein PLL06_12560 [Acidobacteriota bacterium]|nr:hypothetical protein [Acidobacteriota bacterium]HNB72717.1 hypothetical protein [Acidobacteriota bacterium]HNC44196.1 hypothetical protein [Acidobacteriota bacterium]HND20339.1 hypothetical protein [Acidobacteriota bacterium]
MTLKTESTDLPIIHYQRDGYCNQPPDAVAQAGLEDMIDDPYWANHKQEQYWFRRGIQQSKKKPVS